MSAIYTPNIDLDSIVAIDMHTHTQRSVTQEADLTDSERELAMGKFFNADVQQADTVPKLAEYYRTRKMAAVTFTVDTWGVDGKDPIPGNEEIAHLAAEDNDIVIPFASVHPARGKAGVELAEKLITEYGVRGFKFHPNGMAFFPNDPLAYGLYEVLDHYKIPALFHTGQSGAGAGVRAGGGIRLKYSNPIFLDDVAVDFPDMPIIMAHPSFPWQEEALAVAVHKRQVYIDLSGWSPKYFPPLLVQYANTLIKDRVLFGSDFPLITPERWLKDLESVGIRPEVLPGLLKGNAARLLGLA